MIRDLSALLALSGFATVGLWWAEILAMFRRML